MRSILNHRCHIYQEKACCFPQDVFEYLGWCSHVLGYLNYPSLSSAVVTLLDPADKLSKKRKVETHRPIKLTKGFEWHYSLVYPWPGIDWSKACGWSLKEYFPYKLNNKMLPVHTFIKITAYNRIKESQRKQLEMKVTPRVTAAGINESNSVNLTKKTQVKRWYRIGNITLRIFTNNYYLLLRLLLNLLHK